jgi:SAM-dependent methyltransferase
MEAYKEFADIYDESIASYDNRVYDNFLNIINSAIKKYNPKTKTILELGCGTGNILFPLSKHYETTGLDNSNRMLEIAKKKDKSSKYILSDMTSFKLGKTFDIVLCIFDTINHVKTFTGWEKTFQNAYEHLNKNGLFIFDFNTQAKFEEFRTKRRNWHHFGKVILLSETYLSGDSLIFDDTIIKKYPDGKCKVYRETIAEKTFELKNILKALIKTGFNVKKVIDSSTQKEPTSSSKRVFVISRKE